MKNRSLYAQLELKETDKVMLKKEGTMLYFRVFDSYGVVPSFRVDITCQSDAHALEIMEGIRGKNKKNT